jgi:RHS repeat-associated protein
MTNQSLNKGSQVLQKYDYGYGKVDLATGAIDTTKNNGQLGSIDSYIGATKQSQQRFDYDSIGRLAESREYRSGNNSNLTYKQKFDFDRFGNMYRKAANNGTAGQANPLPMTAIESSDISKSTNRFSTNTTYNDAGMVIADNKFRSMNFSYDANGRQVNATNTGTSTTATTVYDALGNRVATKINVSWQFVIYDAFGKLVAEYGTQGEGNGGVSYVLQDWQGSVRASVNNNGFIQARFDFSAFGEEISLGIGTRSIEQGYSGDATTRQGYGLTEKDSSGLNHTWFRKQEQRAGRWTSPDPYKGSMKFGNPQSFNRYSYVDNDPTNFIDPGGLLKQGDRCYITQPDGTQIPGKTDQYGGCNPDLGNIQPVYIYWNDLFPIFGNITRPGDLYPSRGPDIEVGGGGGCGVNPATGSSGIAVDSGNPRGGRPGGLGHLRPGVGGAGGFKERTGGNHGGNDIVAPVGTPIHANRDGTVVATQFGYNGGYGNTVIISNGGIYTQYSHLTSISVSAGASVNQGQIIGTSGRTGNVPRGQAANEDHVHFEVFTGQLNGKFRPNASNRQNPTNYLNSPCP